MEHLSFQDEDPIRAYDTDFTLQQLHRALNSCKDTNPGPSGIMNDLLKHPFQHSMIRSLEHLTRSRCPIRFQIHGPLCISYPFWRGTVLKWTLFLIALLLSLSVSVQSWEEQYETVVFFLESNNLLSGCQWAARHTRPLSLLGMWHFNGHCQQRIPSSFIPWHWKWLQHDLASWPPQEAPWPWCKRTFAHFHSEFSADRSFAVKISDIVLTHLS